MATNRIQVELGISADVSAAQRSISNLENSLSKLYKKQEQSGFQDLGLNEAVKTAKELEVCLSRALNQKTGKLDISAFQNGLKTAGLSMDQLNQKLLSAGSAGQQVFASLASSIAQAEIPLKRTNKLVSEFTRSIKNVFTYQISASMFQAVTSALSDAVNYTKDLNASLNDIRIVTGQSSAQMAKFAAEANKSAQKLSTTTNNYTKASLIFYQQGLSDAEVKKRTDAVVKMANVTKESMNDVSSYMTAIWNNFDDGSESLEHYADVMTALGAATASSTKEIAAGLEKFASIGKTIGLSYEYATSAVATIVDKTRQSAETVGTGLRTIFSRLQGLSLGETLEDGVDLNKYSSALKTVGVNILDASGNMKEMDSILDSLAVKWGNLSNAQKTALAQTVGGVRQYTTLISLMDNWDSMKQNLNTANTADGSLQKQQDIYAEGWEAAAQRSKAALEGLYQTLLNDKGFIALTDGLTTVTKAVTSLVSAMGGLPGILSTVGMIATKVFSKQITQGVRGATDKLTTWGSQFKNQGFWKSAGKIIRGESQSAAQVKANQAFGAQERSQSATMEYLKSKGKQRSIEYMAAEQAQTLIGRKRKLMENSGRLTEDEQQRAQDKINALGEAQERRLALRQEKEQQAVEFSKLEDNAISEFLAVSTSQGKGKRKGKKKTQTPDQHLKDLYDLAGLTGTGAFQVETGDDSEKRRNNLQGMITTARGSARDQALADDYLGMIQKGALADPDQRKGAIKEINAAFGTDILAEDADLDAVETKLQEISQQAAEARAAMDDLIKISDTDSADQKNAKKKIKELLDKAGDQGAELASRDKEEGHVAGKIKGFEEDVDGILNGEQLGDKLAAGLEKATATVGGLVTGFTQAKSAMEVLGDTSASIGDQISAGMSIASGAVTAFATGGPWAAVAYLVGVVGSIAVDALIKQFNAAEIAAQKAEAVSASLSAAADEAASHLNAISSAVDGYEGAIETLNSCTKGTQEWSDALKNVHSSISELLTEFPQLLEYSNLFNTDGTLNQDVLDQAVETAKIASVAADAAAIEGQVAAKQARLEANTVSYSRDYTKYYQTVDQYGDTYYEDYNSGYNDNNKYSRTLRGDLSAILNSYQLFGSEALELGDVYAILQSEVGGNIDITEEYAQSLLNLANQSVAATTMMDNAAKSIISDWAAANGTDLITGQSEFMTATYNEAVKTFKAAVEEASNQNKKQHNKDHSKLGSAFDNTSFKGMSVTEAFNHARGTNYQLASNGVRGVDDNRTYVYLENGEEKIYKMEEMQATIAAAAALEQMGDAAAKAKEKIANISNNLAGSNATDEEKARAQIQEVGLQNYLASKNLESMTESDFTMMQDTVENMGGASAYLQRAFGMTAEEITNAFGQDFITNFENTLTRTETAWADAWGNNKDVAVEALGEVTKEMSLSNVAKLSNYMDEFSLGPAGAEAGAQFVEGLNKMIEDIDPEQQQAALTDLLTTVDWTSYDAFNQAQVILKKYGITINETDAYWKDFVADMRLAAGAMPDFSKIKTDLNSISAIVKDLKFGDIVDKEDYQALIAYNDEWERFFLLQADGSRQFIGNAEDFNKFIQEKTIADREEIDLRRTVSELEGIGDVKWSEGGDAAKEAFEKYMQDDSFKALMEKMGYTSDMIGSMTAEQLKEMYTRIGEAVNANQIELDQAEFEQMIASMATSFAELDALYKDGTISADTYSRALLSMASGYEYCSTAAEDYVKAIGTDREDEARAALEAAVEAEEAASKLETAYSNAMSGKSSMTVEDLKALKESNEELYNSFLTMSDDDWYEAAYQAQVELLEQRMAGQAQESAGYKALMAEKQALDEEYYQNEKEKRQEAYNQFIDNWKERNNKTQTAIDALSIFEDGTAYGAQSFEAIEKLRQALLDTGKTAEEVDQILNNLGKDKDLDEVETVWAAAQEEARLLLEKAGNNQQAQNDLGMDSNVQLVLTGVENQSSLIEELDGGFAAKGKNTEINAEVVDGGLVGGSKKPVLTVDGSGNLVVRTGDKIVPFSAYVTESDDGTLTSGALGNDGEGLYIKVIDPETGKELKVYINDSGAVFNGGVITQIGDSYGVKWSDDTGKTYWASLSSFTLFNQAKLNYNTGSKAWEISWTGTDGKTYSATLSSILGGNQAKLNYNTGSKAWELSWTGKDGKNYTATLNSDFGKKQISGLAYNNGWYIKFKDDATGKEFTASLSADFMSDPNWQPYLDFDTTNGFSLKMKNAETGEVIPVSLDESTLSALANGQLQGSFIKYEEGKGFYIETAAGIIPITPQLNLEGSGFALVNGKLQYEDGTVVGQNGEVLVTDSEGGATVYGENGEIVGELNSEQFAQIQDGTAVDPNLNVMGTDEDGNIIIDGGESPIAGISYMTAREIAEVTGIDVLTNYDTWLGEGYNVFRDMDADDTLIGQLAEYRTGDIGSVWGLGQWEKFMQYSYLNAGSDSSHQKYAIPFLKAAGRSNFYASNGQEVWRTGRTAGDISSDIYDDMSRMLGTLGRYEQWLSDTESDILFAHSLGFDERNTGFFNDNFSREKMLGLLGDPSNDGALDPAAQAYFDGIMEEFTADPEYFETFMIGLKEMLASDSVGAATKAQGLFMAQGLIMACSEGLGEDHAIIVALQNLLSDMNATLGIASPSRITMQMGRYLAQGLQKGALEEDVDLSPLAEKALSSINTYLLNNGDNIPGVRKISQALHAMGANVFGQQLVPWSQAWREYRSTLQPGEVASNTGFRAWATDVKGYTYKDHNYYRPTTEQEYNDYLSTIGMSIQRIDGKYQIFGKDGKALVNKTFDNYNAALTEAIYGIYTEEAMIKYFSKNKDDNFLNYQDDASLTQIQKGLMDTLLDETLETAFEDTGTVYADWDALVNAVGFDKAMEYLNSAYSKHNVQFLNDTEMVWAQFNDIMVNAVSKQIEIEDKAAKEIVDIWKSAFQAILNARKAMLEGKSFIDDLSDDDLKSMIGQYAAAGMSPEDIRAMMFKTSGQTLPAFNMAYNTPASRSFLDSLLSYNAQGFVTSDPMKQTSSGTFIENDGFIAFKQGMEAALTSKIQTGMDEKLYGQLFTSDAFQSALATGNMETIIAAAQTINPTLTKDEIELIALAAEKDKETGKYTFDKINVAAAVDRYIKKMYPDLHQTYQDTVTGRVYTDLDYQKTVLNSARASGELYVNQQQEKFDIVSKAREAMLRGEDLRYALTEAEQKELLEITNQSDLTAVSLGDLDSASTTLTNTMILCAQQLAVAMGMIERGEATSFNIDKETGAVTVTKTSVNQDEVDKFLTSKQITRDDMGNYYQNGQAITETSNAALWGEIQRVIQNNTTTTSVPLSGAPSNNTGDVLDNAGAGNDDAVRLQYAQEAGYGSLQEQDDYIDYLIEESKQAGITDEADLNREYLEEMANDIMEVEKAWQDLYETQASNIAIMKQGRKGTLEYQKALTSLTKTVKKVFGGAESVTEEFVEQHLEDIEKMADGDEKALERVEDALLSKILGTDYNITVDVDLNDDGLDDKIGDVIDGFNDIELTIDGISQALGDVQEGTLITPQIDTTGATGALIGLLNQGGETAAGIMEALNAIGWTPEVDVETYPVESRGIINGVAHYEYMDSEGNIHTFTGGSEGFNEETMTITVPKIGENGATQYKGLRKTGAGTSTTGDKRGGGGGGGARRRYLAKAKPEDHKERYHEIDNAIDDVTDALERLNKQQDRAWGADRLKSMQAESAELKKQADLIGDKIAEAEAYKAIDKEAAEDWGWRFDADGNVKNYEKNWDKLLAKYNAKVAEYNNMSAAEQEALDKQYEEANDKYWAKYQADMAKAKTEEEKDDVRKKYEKWINPETETAFGSYEEYLKYTMLDAPTEALKQYEETMELLEELGLEMADVLNSWYDNVLEQIQYKLDLALELTENELNIIDYKLKSIEDNAYRAGEALGLMTQKMDASKANFNAYYDALDNLLKANNADWSADKLLSGEITKEDLFKAELQSGDIEIIKTVMEGLRESTAAMTEQMIEGYETMTDSFESFNEELQRYISTIEHAENVTSAYKNILDLTGRSMSGFTSTMLKKLNALVVEQAQHKLSSNKTALDTIRKEFETAQAAYKKAQEDFAAGNGDQAALDVAKKAYETAQDNLDEAEENFLASWEETLQAAADAFESNIEEITRTIGEALSGGLAGGLAELEDQFAKVKEQDEMYVDDYEKIYQLTKMTRDLESKIDNTTNVRAQREMLKLQKEINGLLESDKKLSQYDIEYLQKKADLKMAEIAMQDAQNAKSQVTMRRDSEGNYNYVYTADEDAVEKAEQEYADKLYEMQVANDEYITTLQENMSALSSQMLNEIASIDRTVYDTEEKYRAEVERITNHYSTMMGHYNSEMKKVLDNNTILYNEDWTEFNKFTGYKISAAENYVTKWNQTMLSQVTGFDTQEDYYANFNKTLFGDNPESPSSDSLIGQVLAAYRTMTQQIAEANKAAGLEKGTLADLVTDGIDAATDAAEAAAQNITTQAGLITTAIEGIGAAISTMAANYAADFKRMSDATDILNRRLSDFLMMAGSSQEFSIDAGVLSQIRARLDAEGFDTGGYTGTWGSEGKLAFLHQKELVLNAEDTANMLASVGILRQIANVIDLNALTSAGGFISLMSSGVRDNKETLQQEVHIEAHFPNATDKNQIEDAFKDIVNLAAQYANRSSF